MDGKRKQESEVKEKRRKFRTRLKQLYSSLKNKKVADAMLVIVA